MPLPEPILDDLRFQRDLVDEARRRIIRYCPEWTDYNVSDPGITLIELFAWMTEMIVYRLNLVPEKNHIKFMELLGVQLQPANSARGELTFRLSAPFPITIDDDTTAVVPLGTEVATRATDESVEVIFTTDEKLEILPPKLTQVRSPEDFNKNFLPRMQAGVEIFYAFARPRPRLGDTFYLGFDNDGHLAGHVLRLDFENEETQATGVRRTNPPLVWEISSGDNRWEEVTPSTFREEQDTTGGLNNATGTMIFYLPLTAAPNTVQGRNAYWLRCRLEQRRRDQPMYSQSPRIRNITAYSLGATTRATHAVVVKDEFVGTSDGEPGQIFRLQQAPVLAPRPGETVTVEEKRDGELVPIEWTLVRDFSNSDRYDRHFTLDTATGEIAFGPAVRQPDGSVRQYGRTPEAGRQIMFTQYRHGGGVAGNVPAGRIQMLKSAVPYIDSVTNLRRAEGGRDQETLDEAKLRARREVRAQQRAVTADDYEVLAKGTSRAVARVKCLTPSKAAADGAVANLPPGMLELLVVPAVFDALRNGDATKLALDDHMSKAIEAHLEPYRLLTTTVRVREPRYIGIRAYAEIVVTEFADPETVRAAVRERLRLFIAPLDLAQPNEPKEELLGSHWEGWPFGRSLFIAEIFSLVQRVPGVKHVLDVRLSQRAVNPRGEAQPRGDNLALTVVEPLTEAGAELERIEPPLLAVDSRRLDIPADTLLCSLEHEIRLVEL